ncbi:Alpha/beta hydrolase family protein [Rubripirellula lacrimiformis]|uniref:Alpha/beta hydrolase family protein n=1 Tax=Rubripirellula lacrimiformis TaxID=1930273 RepID=A0A517N3L3_9BACT|nr:alpha/beta hydrolase family protein [Rubripirellula lacrimiformis]QDT01725.1 Alpha/beta hydrolase family protein [Rubripirellula lacrimiformis]
MTRLTFAITAALATTLVSGLLAQPGWAIPPSPPTQSAEPESLQSQSTETQNTEPVVDLPSEPEMAQRFNLPIKTGGGTQMWTDHAYRNGYRIQQHAWTGHWRLIDAGDVRRAWGTQEACESELDRLVPPPIIEHPPKSIQDAATPTSATEPSQSDPANHTVVLLHGLMRTRHSMKPLETAFNAAGITNVIRFSYASSRASIGDHAAGLRDVVEGMPADTQFSFVGHSMGNIVVRHLIADLERSGDPAKVLPRCRCMVMLGPPNQGAAIARRLAPTGIYGWVTGKGGLELGPQWKDFESKLSTPSFPFMIIAGDVSKAPIANPLVDGSSDFVVSLDEAKLQGAEQVQVVPVLHSFLMNDEQANQMTVDFVASH